MKFGEKVKECRTAAGMTQGDLAKAIGVSLRTVMNYENENKYPKQREVYAKLAEIFGRDVNYFLTENEEFVLGAGEKYGSRGRQDAERLIEDFRGLFAGGELSEEAKDGVMRAIQEAYWDAKEENKKYTPKKYRK